MLELQVNSGVIDSISLVMSLVLKEEEEGKRERTDPSSHLSQAIQKVLMKTRDHETKGEMMGMHSPAN